MTIAICGLWMLSGEAYAGQQAPAPAEPSSPQAMPAAVIQGAIDKLGDLDYDMRTTAARIVRRTSAAQAVPALIQAVSEHSDGYVRYRALVLLTGFNDPRARDVMHQSLSSPNDRLRTVGYAYFEHHPDPAMADEFLRALDNEQGEFVRPALVRALAALAASPGGANNAAVRQALVRDVSRGQDFFRSVVIEALGDYKATYAFDALTEVAKLDGPLQGDAALALGKLNDRRALETLADLQRTAPRQTQPTIATGICLLGVNCSSHEMFLIDTLAFADKNPGFQELLRTAAAGLGALAVARDHEDAVKALFTTGIPSRDPTRSPVALALATVALRNTPLMLSLLSSMPNREPAIDLMAEGFDMLEEDFEKETFFTVVRRSYWDAPEDSPTRALMQTLIGKLDF